MAKSKLVKANEKIAEGVTAGFQQMSDSVVGGYKKIEDGFVDRYLTKNGETVEEAKARLHAEETARREAAQIGREARRKEASDGISPDRLHKK